MSAGVPETALYHDLERLLLEQLLRDTRSRLVCVSPAEPPPPPNLGTGSSEEALSQAQIELAHAVMEGTEYPSVRREHALLRASGRVEYVTARSEASKRVLSDFSRSEGIVPCRPSAPPTLWHGPATPRQRCPSITR